MPPMSPSQIYDFLFFNNYYYIFIYKFNMVSPFSVVYIFIYLGLTNWDWITYQRLFSGANLFPPSQQLSVTCSSSPGSADL